MAMSEVMALTMRLLSQAQALAAVTAYARLAGKGERASGDLQARIEDVVGLVGIREALDELTDRERSIVVSFARSYLRQSLELMDDPGRPNAWSHSDPTILQAQGAASAVVATLISGAGLGAPGIRVLDIGSGVAGLSVAFCREFPDATVVGLDPWEPSMELARANVAEAGLEDRITLEKKTIQAYEDSQGFDLIWFPSFFIPEPVLDEAFRRVKGLLRPGGSLVVGVFEQREDPLAAAVDAMITVRSGGTALEPEEVIRRLKDAGFGEVGRPKRTWEAPLQLVVATAPTTPPR